MAIPKICGIENEFSLSAFDKDWRPLPSTGYSGILFRFVKESLLRHLAVKFDQSQETRRSSFLPVKDDEAKFVNENLHNSYLTEKIIRDLDGFLDNGARFYLDCWHPEYSTPECLVPLDAVAHDKGSELFMLQSLQAFKKQELNRQYKVVIHKNNSDGLGHSYGCHLNILLDRKLADCRSNSEYLIRSYVPFQIARMVLFGAGKLGSENGQPKCRFQIWQRSDFFTSLHSLRTMENRPLFNTRDEPHANAEKYFRLHDISTDALRCEQAIFLKVALTQIMLAMIEDHFLKDDFFPDDPLTEAHLLSRDLSFKHRMVLENGKKITGLELLRFYLRKAQEYLNLYPMHEQHVAAVQQGLELVDKLEKDWESTVGALDWTTARLIIEANPEKARKNLFQFQEINDNGLFNRLVRAGKIQRLLTDELIAGTLVEPPKNTRAFVRSRLIKKYRNDIESISWNSLKIIQKGLTTSIDFESPILDELGQSMVSSILEL